MLLVGKPNRLAQFNDDDAIWFTFSDNIVGIRLELAKFTLFYPLGVVRRDDVFSL
jgi:hypothetical protein